MPARPLSALLTLALALLTGAAQAGQTGPVQRDHIEVELVAAAAAATPGQPLTVALRMLPDTHWHTYWRNPGDSGLATRLDWQLPDGVTAGPILWPFPERQAIGPLTNYGYSGEHFLLTEITVPAGYSASTLDLAVSASWLVCEDVCIPGDADLALSVPVSGKAAGKATRHADAIAAARARVPEIVQTPAQFAVDGQTFRLQADVTPHGDSALAFFPQTAEIVDNAADPLQRRGVDGQIVDIAVPLSDFFNTPPGTFSAVLVIDGERAIEFEAQPVELAALLPDSSLGAATTANATSGSSTGVGLLAALGLALLGGLILNLMPCVFPVLSIKAMAVARSGEHDTAMRRRHALAYTGGVVLGFVALAAGLLALRAAGQAVGWGFQLQSPLVVGALGYLMFLLGLSLHGYFEIGTRLMGVGQGLTERGGNGGAFFTGLLACVVATPCTAPFMGAAMGFAVTQPALIALLVFAALGVGMAIPFLLIGFVPGSARVLPRPGPWMDTFKQIMAFPLYLTAIWLGWVLGQQVGINGMAAWLVGGMLIVVAVWLWQRPGRGLVAKIAAPLTAIAALMMLSDRWFWMQPASAGVETPAADAQWQPYSPGKLDALLTEGTPVFINLTAAWCVTCHVNERVALKTRAVQQAMQDAGITYLKGDWTNRDPDISALLDRHNRPGVPLYLLYSGRPGSTPVVLPQILTPQIVIDAINALSPTPA